MEVLDSIRRLQDDSFAGWDISMSAYATNYLTMFVAIACGALMWRHFGQSGDWSDVLPFTFASYSLLTGLSAGFMAMAMHMLATMQEEGNAMSKVWFDGHSKWLFPYTLAAGLAPLASAVCLGAAFAYVRFSSGWLRAAKCVGLALSCWEVALCCTDVDNSSIISHYWGLCATAVSVVLVAVLGREAPGFVLVLIGFAIQLVGYFVSAATGFACSPQPGRMVQTAAGPLYVKETPDQWFCSDSFDRLTFFHACCAASLPVLYFGIMLKADRDREQSYLSMMRTAYQKETPRCCGV
mmetsp:Transcript_55010/g.154322  ORF Transcript_55010/g.154322 Transcript_55010/m.154322 type:complete len:295 (+) Transcript_55010:50-934(+)